MNDDVMSVLLDYPGGRGVGGDEGSTIIEIRPVGLDPNPHGDCAPPCMETAPSTNF